LKLRRRIKVKGLVNILALFLLTSISALAQPWTCNSTGESQTIIFEDLEKILIEGETVSKGDVIGVFYNHGQENWECIGELLVQESSGEKSMETKGVLFSELTPVEILNNVEFRVWDKSKNCITVVNQENLGIDGQSLFDSNNTEAVIQDLLASEINIEYPRQVFCEGEGEFSPHLPFSDGNVHFFAEGVETLSIDQETGLIDVAQSKPGGYFITMESNYCLASNELEIEIIERPEIQVPERICSYPVVLSLDNPEGVITWNQYWRKPNFVVNEAKDVFVKVENRGCVFNDEVTIKFEPLDQNKYDYEIEPAQCDEKGQIKTFFTEGYSNPTGTFIAGKYILELNEFEPVNDGVYPLYFQYDNGCVDTLPVTFSILSPNAPSVQGLSYEVEPVVCKEKGKITLLIDSIIGSAPYTYLLDGIEYETPVFENLSNAFYNLEIVDSKGCSTAYEEVIEVGKLGCSDHYFYPDLDGGSVTTTFKIETAGDTRIYDREGNEVRSLTTPASWDGRDSHGSLVPMGEYYIITDEEVSQKITVFR
jgi:hypothetical protein